PAASAFFLSARGRPMGRGELNKTFTTLIRQVGLEGRGSRARPRPYDLRHSFAVYTLLGWYRAGENVDRRMPLLSTFMGHSDPAASCVWMFFRSAASVAAELGLTLVWERLSRERRN